MNSRPIIGPIKIEEIHSSGKGFGIWNDKKYFIPYTIPGEIVYAQTENRRLGFRTARITEIVNVSPYRVHPVCSYFGVCGGCDFMHIEYKHQLQLKKHILQEAFNKYNIQYITVQVEPALENIHYRNKVTYQIKYERQNIIIGFHPEWEHKNVIDIEYCYLLQPTINKVYKLIRNELIIFYENNKDTSIQNFTIRCNKKGECQVIFALKKDFSENSIIFISKLKKISEIVGIHYLIKEEFNSKKFKLVNINETEPFLYENILNTKLRISPLTFFQNNLEITEKILSYIKENIDFNKVNTIFELYSGNGAISLSLTNNLPINLHAIEGNIHAINDAIYNSHGKTNHIHICGDVLKTFNQTFINTYPKPDVVILNPPRSGTLIEIQKTIMNAKPKTIIYISCNPISLAWNLQQLCKNYVINNVKAFDMFPQTHQLETVVIMALKN